MVDPLGPFQLPDEVDDFDSLRVPWSEVKYQFNLYLKQQPRPPALALTPEYFENELKNAQYKCTHESTFDWYDSQTGEPRQFSNILVVHGLKFHKEMEHETNAQKRADFREAQQQRNVSATPKHTFKLATKRKRPSSGKTIDSDDELANLKTRKGKK
jgi:hypothetical protein